MESIGIPIKRIAERVVLQYTGRRSTLEFCRSGSAASMTNSLMPHAMPGEDDGVIEIGPPDAVRAETGLSYCPGC